MIAQTFCLSTVDRRRRDKLDPDLFGPDPEVGADELDGPWKDWPEAVMGAG